MSKKPRFRTLFHVQHTKGSQTRRLFYHFFLSVSEKWSWKMYLLATYPILGMFVNTGTPMTSILFVMVRIFYNHFKWY